MTKGGADTTRLRQRGRKTLFVSLASLAGHLVRGQDNKGNTNQANLSPLALWLEIRNDNTILVRTGRTEIGTGMSAFYAQTVAEELRVEARNDHTF